MADRSEVIALKILNLIEGEDDVQALAENIRKLAKNTGDAEPEVAALSAELDKIAKDKGLLDQFSRITTELEGTEKALAQAKKEVAFFRESMEKAGDQGAKLFGRDLERAKKEVLSLAESQRKYRAGLKGLTKEMDAAGVSTKKLASQQQNIAFRYDSAKKKAAGFAEQLKKARAEASKPLPDTTGKLRTGLDKTKAAADRLGTAVKGFVLYQLGRLFLDANKSAQTLSKGLELVTGSSKAAAEEMQFIRETSRRLGIDVAAAGKAYLDLAAAAKGTALEGEQTRQIFTSIATAMGRLGKSAADTEGALLAVQQMISKGKVSAEELRGQLGERLPGAFQAAARAMGVTTAELDAMLKNGELVAEDLLPKLAAELNKTFDSQERVESFTASWNRFKDSASNAFVTLEGSAGVMGLVGSAMEGLGTVINFAVVGFVTLVERVKATATAVGALWDLLSRKTGLLDFKKTVKEAFDEADAAIAKAADQAFGMDENLKKAGASGKDAGDKTAQAMAEAGKATAATATAASKAQEAYGSLAEAAKTLGLDLEELNSGLSETSRELITAFDEIATSIDVSGEALLMAFKAAIAKTDDMRTLTALTRSFNQALEEQGHSAEIAEKAHAALKDKVDELDESANKAAKKIEALGNAETYTARAAWELDKAYREGRITLDRYYAGAEKLTDSFLRERKAALAAADGIGAARESVSDTTDAVNLLRSSVDGLSEKALVNLKAKLQAAFEAGLVSAEKLKDKLDEIDGALERVAEPKVYTDTLSRALAAIGKEAGLTGAELEKFIEENLAAVWRAWEVGGGKLERLLQQLRREAEALARTEDRTAQEPPAPPAPAPVAPPGSPQPPPQPYQPELIGSINALISTLAQPQPPPRELLETLELWRESMYEFRGAVGVMAATASTPGVAVLDLAAAERELNRLKALRV